MLTGGVVAGCSQTPGFGPDTLPASVGYPAILPLDQILNGAPARSEEAEADTEARADRLRARAARLARQELPAPPDAERLAALRARAATLRPQ